MSAILQEPKEYTLWHALMSVKGSLVLVFGLDSCGCFAPWVSTVDHGLALMSEVISVPCVVYDLLPLT